MTAHVLFVCGRDLAYRNIHPPYVILADVLRAHAHRLLYSLGYSLYKITKGTLKAQRATLISLIGLIEEGDVDVIQ